MTEDILEEGEATLRDAAAELGALVERVRTAPGFRRLLLRRGDQAVVVDLVFDRVPQIFDDKPEQAGIRVDPPAEVMANKLCTLLSRAEIRDLVDVRALEPAGYTVEDHLPLAVRLAATYGQDARAPHCARGCANLPPAPVRRASG